MLPGAINTLPTPPCTLRVNGIPSFVTQADFSRLMLQLEGCTDARLLGRQPGGDQVGYAEFGDKMNASKAKNLYHGWTGWGGRGLAIELVDFALSQLAGGGGGQPVGQKRLREDEDLQPDGGYKQARADGGVMGVGGLQQPGAHQQALGLLQNLLQQQPGIAQQLLASAQQQAPGVLQPQQGQGYAPAPVQAQQQPLQPQYTAAPVQQQYGVQPAQQPVLQQQLAPTYAQQQPVQPQPQPVLLQQQPAQQQYLAPQPPQPVMVQGGMLPQQQPMLQQQPQMMAQPQPQLVQQPQPQAPGMPMQGGRRGDIVAPAGMRQYPPDACNTLYIEGMPADVSRRELAHIFRAHDGFRSLRLVIKDSKKHVGEKLVMAFAEFTSTYFATEAMDRLQARGYPFDLDDPETMTFFVKYARPMDHPPRRGPPPGGPPGMGRGRGGPPPQGSRSMAGAGGRGGGRYGPGGGPPRESPR